MDSLDLERKLNSVALDSEGDLLFLKMLHPDMCKLKEDDRLQFRMQLLQLLRKYRQTKENQKRDNMNSNDGPAPNKKMKVESSRKQVRQQVRQQESQLNKSVDDIIILD